MSSVNLTLEELAHDLREELGSIYCDASMVLAHSLASQDDLLADLNRKHPQVEAHELSMSFQSKKEKPDHDNFHSSAGLLKAGIYCTKLNYSNMQR